MNLRYNCSLRSYAVRLLTTYGILSSEACRVGQN